MRSLRARVLSEACAVGLEARLRAPDAGRVQRLCVQAAGLAAEDDAGAVIAAFGAVFAGARYDRAVLAAAGDALVRGALRALMPAPVDAGRVDIHG